MPIRFILGRAGSGKTEFCLSAIRRDLRRDPAGPPIIFLVPEQATFTTERAILATAELAASRRAQVLSFRRLSLRALREVGGAVRPPIGALGKVMLLSAILREHAEDFRLFGQAAKAPGFIQQVGRTLSELQAYRVGPGELEEALARLAASGDSLSAADSALAAKLHDLARLQRELAARLGGRFTDPDAHLTLAAPRLERWPPVRGARLFVDGFAGFTPQELALLSVLFRQAESVQVALCLDPALAAAPLDETHLFHPTHATYRQLTALAEGAGVPIEPPLALGAGLPRFRRSPALAHVEAALFAVPTSPEAGPATAPPPEAATAIRIFAAADRRAEVEAAGRAILRLCRDEGFRFGAIGVVVWDLAPYHELIAAIFTDLGIPHFVDRKRSISHHPLVELVRAALECIGQDWPCEAVCRYWKTDLAPVPRQAVDELENYVLAHGIRGRAAYAGAWRFGRQDALTAARPRSDSAAEADASYLAAINAAREAAARDLLDCHAAIGRGAATVRQISRALWDLLDQLDVSATLAGWSHAAAELNDLDAARAHTAAWDGLVQLLDEMVAALGDETVSPEEYLGLLEAGLAELQLGLIPPGLDQVLVGEIERSRQPDLRAAFVLGAADRFFPPPPAEDILFTDAERDELAGCGVELAPASRLALFHEQFLAYIALTRASERLWISYPRSDEEGAALAPAPLVHGLQRLFPDLESAAGDWSAPPGPLSVGRGPDGVPGPDDLTAFEDEPGLVAALVRELRRARDGAAPCPAWSAALYERIARDPELRPRALPIVAALAYENQTEPLPPDVARALFGSPLATSVTRLQRFAACPFQHFAAHGLRLSPRPVYELGAPDLGRFYHAALQRVAEAWLERGESLADPHPGEIDSLLDGIVNDLAPRLLHEILLSSERHRYLTGVLRRTLGRTVSALIEHARCGRFRPVAVELRFGGGSGAPASASGHAELPAFQVPLSDGQALQLTGQIDRVELASDGDRAWLRVIDYKTGQGGFRLEEVAYGLSLQLPTYLLVLLAAGSPGFLPTGGVEPAGILLFPARDPRLVADGPLTNEEIEQGRLKQLRMSGLLLGDPSVARLMDESAEGRSLLVPFHIKKDGTLGASSQVADREAWGALLGHTRRRLADLGGAILAGEIAPRPYRLRDRRPCTHCDFQPVCRFDPLIPGNRYRTLAPLRADAAWEAIRVSAEGSNQ